MASALVATVHAENSLLASERIYSASQGLQERLAHSAALKAIANYHLLGQGQTLPINAHVERRLGETEASYFLPSRESGVNDMYLHLGCTVSSYLVSRQRVSLAWAIMRVRHPLLASCVKMNSYEDIVFSYTAPKAFGEAIESADRSLEYRLQSKDELIDSYLNGPRTLSNERLSYLIVSTTDRGDGVEKDYDFLICATHFLGDGMALHQFANDFFSLLGSSADDALLKANLLSELAVRCFEKEKGPTLPSCMEDRLPAPCTKGFSKAAARVDFNESQERLIGGHNFPRAASGPRKTVVPTISIDNASTKQILANCKRHGVSISSALFAVCNVAWARTHSTNWELPIMMYSALNMRQNLLADKRLNDSYWFLAIGYFNIILPSFFPEEGDVSSRFWHRARLAKTQSTQAAKSPMAVSRCLEMAKERGRRARVWAKEDDEKATGTFVKPSPPTSSPPAPAPRRAKVPSNALMGLSLLGNLDGIYKHANFPDIKFHTLTTGSRQRAGGMLLFGYTFAGKLWVSFGYDANGFDKETVERFWSNVQLAINEFLLN
ncbi:hypothetical protein D9613_002249 [Agrocybe pediades]|uniref:Uncharacterized protein n=1 Tax=Agrocybe pediades TaxID=84607 RepID=A0A8H4R534_9AGAR|nr:hypothetical protein D9613_002249 [Agrocybe pediades]